MAKAYMELEDIKAIYAPNHYKSWEEWFQVAKKEAAFNNLLELMAELEHLGEFEDPVILGAADQELDEATNEVVKLYGPGVCDGHHRLAAHYFTGIERVHVQYGYTLYEEEEFSWALKVEITPRTELTGLAEDSWIDKLFELLSWRNMGSKSSPWLQMEFGVGATFYLTCSGDHLLVSPLRWRRG